LLSLLWVFKKVVVLLAINERENLISLDGFNHNVSNFSIQQPGALLASRFQNAQYCAPVELCEPFAGPDTKTKTLGEQVNHLESFFWRNAQIVQRAHWNVRKRPAALFAAEALKTFVEAETVHFGAAIVTCQLDLSWPKP